MEENKEKDLEAQSAEAPKAPIMNASIPSDQFDWDAFENEENYDKAAVASQYENTLSKVVEGTVVDGVITSMTKREITVNIGYKSEGIIMAPEIRYNPDLKVGDKIEVLVENTEDKKGQLVLSHKKARQMRSWDMVNEAYNNNEVIKGYVKTRTKGGMIVDVFGIEAFLPGSQIDVKPIQNYDVFVDTTMDLKIVKINQEFRNVVVSHKALVEAEIEEQKKQILATLEVGQVVEGTVKNITNYGVFVDLGGVDGLIHITDLSWGRVNDPKEIVSLDQKINVVITSFDQEKGRIALGLKQLTPQPWDALDPNLKVGDKITGKVVVVNDYGAFVEVAPGIEGLLHVSEMSWSPRLRIAQDFVKEGEEIEVVVLSIDRDEKKMSLGRKQLFPNPWDGISEKYPVGSKHNATVRNLTNFGVFAELEEGVEGLVHISDLSWNKIKHPSEVVSAGEVIEVVVTDLDEENHKLSLGRKQILPNPWNEVEAKYAVGTVVEAVVASVNEKGAVVTLDAENEGFCPAREMNKQDGSAPVAGETLSFKVTDLKRSLHRITLSHVKTYAVETPKSEKKSDGDDSKKAVKKINSNIEVSTLGDLDALAALKDKLKAE